MRVFIAATIAGLAAACPNACSGNGVCGANSKCSCYQNWQGADCSLRTCPFTLAWADTADGTNQAHYYAECGNKGSCDRKTGECVCFEGYEGKGCRRSTCPESCSGHGTCEYMEELARDHQDRRYGPGAKYKGKSCTSQLDPASCSTGALKTTNVVARSADTDVMGGHNYNLWDAGKIQGCKCDLGYKGPGCEMREVPRGDDPLTTTKADTMTQLIQINPTTDVANSGTKPTGQFFLEFNDPYGGKWVTDTIDMQHNAGSTNWEPDSDAIAAKVEYQLQSLPNEVLSDVSVTAFTSDQAYCTRQYDGVQHLSAYDQTADGRYKNSKNTKNTCSSTGTMTYDASQVNLLVTFGNKPGQTGVQYLLDVNYRAQGAGHYPVSSGFSATASVVEGMANAAAVDLISELSLCSDRGLDNGEGECECFPGYRGLSCEEQEALV